MEDRCLGIAAAAAATAIAAAFIAITVILGHPQTSGGGRRPDGEFIAIPTVPCPDGDECRLALLGGDPDRSSGLRRSGPRRERATARTDDGAALLDRQGHVVAHTGDEVRSAGDIDELGGREGFAVCSNGLHFEPARP